VVRVTSTATRLFNSEITHNHFISLKICQADRKRDLNRDWIHEGKIVTEVTMSMAQWGELVSSIGSGGVPVTLNLVRAGKLQRTPRFPVDSRLSLTMDEARQTATKVFGRIKEAYDAYVDHKTVRNLRSLGAAITGVAPNIKYATDMMVEHAEDTVAKARADIEAMVDDRARELGIDPIQVTLNTNREDRKELDQ